MSSHHSVKFFINHYTQELAAVERKSIKDEIRELKRQEDALKWADYRHKRAVIKAAAKYLYWSEVALYFVSVLTIATIVAYGIRGIL
jgi:hypothetical protein